MAVRIKSVNGRSGFFRAGDEIVSVDGAPVRDQLDLAFLTEQEGSMLFEVRRKDGRTVSKILRPETLRRARLAFEEMRFMRCRSRCIFCFVDQMPSGLRKTLYEKDDDYRLSFLYGNYVTLNDVTDAEIERIVDMHLSPLYLSVHALGSVTRRSLFGRPMKRNIIETMERLASGGITMHVQIVLVPERNDGRILERTVAGLFRLYPAVRSIAVVPVGLTRCRTGLPRVRRPTGAEVKTIIAWAEKKREFYERETGKRFIHLSDEFYLSANAPLPDSSGYDGFPQLANGVGMCRLFLDGLETDTSAIRRSPRALSQASGAALHIVTGTLGSRFMKRYVVPFLRAHLPELSIDIVRVPNILFGSMVGVSGLLAGGDIAREVNRRVRPGGCIVLPSNALNHDGILIDDMTVEDLERTLGRPVLVPETSFLERSILRLCGGGDAA